VVQRLVVDEEFRRRIDEPSEAEFQQLDGRWEQLRPTEAAARFAGFDAAWWIAGGWAILRIPGSAVRLE